MASKFSRITFEERQKIEELLKQGLSMQAIASVIGRTKAGVTNEVRKGGGRKDYSALSAQEKSDQRHARKVTSGVGDEILLNRKDEVKQLIEQGFSFWQIKKRLSINKHLLHKIYKHLNVDSRSTVEMIEDLEDKISAIEGTLLYILEKINTGSNGTH